MGAPGQQAVDEKMVNQLGTFTKNGEKAGIFGTDRSKALRDAIEAWLPNMKAVLDPSSVSNQHKTKIAPQLAVFDRSHDLVASLSLLFQGWARAQDNQVEIEALTGPLLVGEDEEQDEQKLRAWQPIFVKLCGAAALPPSLHNEPVKKQLAAHVAAREALPGTTDGQVYRAAQSSMMTLRATGLGYWARMHSLLDAEFGEGQDAFAAKSALGYERRLRGGGASRKKRVGEKPPADGSSSGGDTGAGGQSSASADATKKDGAAAGEQAAKA